MIRMNRHQQTALHHQLQKPTVFRVTVLPPALGPEITSIRFFSSSVRLTGMVGLPDFLLYRYNNG